MVGRCLRIISKAFNNFYVYIYFVNFFVRPRSDVLSGKVVVVAVAIAVGVCVLLFGAVDGVDLSLSLL